MQPILATKQIEYYGKPAKLSVFGGLHYIKGNSYPYFTLNGEIRISGRKDCEECGMLHDRIIENFPEFSELAKMHLSDINGAPCHSVENGWYWYGGTRWQEYHREHLAEHLRITPAEADELRLKNIDKQTFTAYVESQRTRWEKEADACISRYSLALFGDAFTPEAAAC